MTNSPFYKSKNTRVTKERLLDLFFSGKIQITKEIVDQTIQNLKSSEDFSQNNVLTVTFITAYSSINWSQANKEWYYPIPFEIAEDFRKYTLGVFGLHDYISEDTVPIKEEIVEDTDFV